MNFYSNANNPTFPTQTKPSTPNNHIDKRPHPVPPIVHVQHQHQQQHTQIYADAIRTTLRQYYTRINNLEDLKYDLEYVVKRKDVEVQNNNIFQHILQYIHTSILQHSATDTLKTQNS